MRRLLSTLALVLLLAAMPIGPSVGLAQEATPAAGAPPMGAAIAPLAQDVVEELPPAPADVFLARFTLDPGVGFPIEPSDPSLTFVVVESGAFTFRVATAVRVARVAVAGTPVAQEVIVEGTEFTLNPGDSAVIPPSVAGDVRNAGTEPAVALLGGVAPVSAEATPAATAGAEGTPVAEGEDEAGITFQPLVFGFAEELPAGPIGLAIVRFEFAPGTVFPEVAHPGPELVSLEAGQLSVRTLDGPEAIVTRGLATMATPFAEPTVETIGANGPVTVGAGDGAFFPTGNVAEVRNDGDEAAVGLSFLIQPVAAAGTPEP